MISQCIFLFSVATINLQSILFRTLSVIIIQSLYSIDEIIKYYFRQFIVATMDFYFRNIFCLLVKFSFRAHIAHGDTEETPELE